MLCRPSRMDTCDHFSGANKIAAATDAIADISRKGLGQVFEEAIKRGFAIVAAS